MACPACGPNCTDFSKLRAVVPGASLVFANPLQCLFKLFFTLVFRFLMESRGPAEPAGMRRVNLMVFTGAFIAQSADNHALHLSLAI
jgi:hypothetical protein